MNYLDQTLLNRLSAEAKDSPRKRKNLNLHPTDDFCCHRLLNAVEPGTYIRPHYHADPNKDESMVMVRGRMGLVAFDDGGQVQETRVIAAGGETFAVDIPHGRYHTAISLEPGSVFFEAKAGPYRPLTTEELAPWAPEEGAPEVLEYLARLKALFTP